MFDSVLEILSNADLISPTIALFKNARNGPSVQFSVPFDVGWSAVQIEEMLKSKGIIVWGVGVQGDDITFTVRQTQARYTAYWLNRYRLPHGDTMDGSNQDAKSAGRARDSDPDAKSERTGIVDGVLDRIDGLVDSL
jgi:hypothetical protein